MDPKLMRLVVITLLSTLTVACTNSPAAGPAGDKPTGTTQAIAVKATDVLKFEPATITVKSGAPVRLMLTNDGALDHNWVVDSLGGKTLEVDAKPKASTTVEFTPTASGTYEFYCSVPGHREAGMKGTLVVQ
jgi:uncharacterized cupredoxin-like copper-binding protein